jgi:pimeloyl-ACP methyl ester carboxylesterase
MGAWVWEPLARELPALGHHPTALTLTGLDDADRDPSEVGLSTHVDVVGLLAGMRLRNVILVGHSYSGIVAGQVAAYAPDRVDHIVFIEAFLPEQGRSLLDVSGLDKEREEHIQTDKPSPPDHEPLVGATREGLPVHVQHTLQAAG